MGQQEVIQALDQIKGALEQHTGTAQQVQGDLESQSGAVQEVMNHGGGDALQQAVEAAKSACTQVTQMVQQALTECELAIQRAQAV